MTSQDYPDWDGRQIKEYIDVGEWDLAADSLAYCYLPGNYEITKAVFNIFFDLAKRMDPLDDDIALYQGFALAETFVDVRFKLICSSAGYLGLGRQLPLHFAVSTKP
jgi:hypothetical protein